MLIEDHAHLGPSPVGWGGEGECRAMHLVHRAEHAHKRRQRFIRISGNIDNLCVWETSQQRLDTTTAKDILGEIRFVGASGIDKTL